MILTVINSNKITVLSLVICIKWMHVGEGGCPSVRQLIWTLKLFSRFRLNLILRAILKVAGGI
jgi:hypothetical protein